MSTVDQSGRHRAHDTAYTALATSIQARHLQTPLEEATWLDADADPHDSALLLEKQGFDQAPVRHHGRLTGYVVTSELVRATSSRIEGVVHPLDESTVVSGSSSVFDVMESLVGPNLLSFVIDGHAVSGFVTPSDLNKHPARAHFYLLLADLEIALASTVRRQFTELTESVELLEPNDRKKVIGRYKRDTANNVDVDLVAGMDLRHLLRVVDQTAALLDQVGATDQATWEQWTGHLPSLRNAVMHPVLAFLGRRRSVEDLLAVEANVRSMLSRMLRASETGEAESPG